MDADSAGPTAATEMLAEMRRLGLNAEARYLQRLIDQNGADSPVVAAVVGYAREQADMVVEARHLERLLDPWSI